MLADHDRFRDRARRHVGRMRHEKRNVDGLRDRRELGEVGERDEIVEQRGYPVRWRRYERGVARTGTAPADPVLIEAHDARESLLRCAFEKDSMDVDQIRHTNPAGSGTDRNRSFHEGPLRKDHATSFRNEQSRKASVASAT